MAVRPHSKITVADYLTLESGTLEKHEYFQGEVFAMGGASAIHNLVVANIIRELISQLRKTPCLVYPSHLRVKVSHTGLYTYPDAIVVCDKPNLEQPGDTLLNPTVIIEVLSDSSELYDRGRKFEHYRTLTTLNEYLLVDQRAPKMELYSRQPQQRWLLSAANSLAESISISSIRCDLTLADVYHKIEWSSAE
ncbi:MAG: Uma2 family endonuclease [Burkholderiales bacterium]